MPDQRKLHSDSVSLAGFYYGVVGTFLGAAGIALSVYYSNSGEKSLWLSLSGWISAILIGIFLTRLCFKLLEINGKLSNVASEQSQNSIELAARVGELEYANDRLTEIGSYVIATTTKSAVKPRQRATPVSKKASVHASKEQRIESEDMINDN
ncbi:hypothetical protein ACQJ22_01130 [Pseudomonas fragariae (ex Marin et al. 2024)]|uniref:hypothetical protein n=1 Tax=Pseudomonas TaxID=286 RepID=UPI0011DCB108|nr:hypothetical protein [Pseudomonas syringae]